MTDPGTRRQLDNLRVLLAPAARDTTAIVDDPADLQLAQAIIAGMDSPGARPSTRGEILAMAGHDPDDRTTQNRFALYVRLGMLRTVRGDKAHQQRYYLHPFALIGGELLSRLASRGAAAQLHDLLLQAADLLDDEGVGVDDVRRVIERVTTALDSFSQLLEDVERHGTMDEMLDARQGHHAVRHFESIQQLAAAVRSRFEVLMHPAMRLVTAGQRYIAAVEVLVARITGEVAAHPDTSVLALADPEDFDDGALTADVSTLSSVLADTVVDLARPVVDLPSLVAALDEFGRPPPPPREVPDAPPPDDDPVAELTARRHERERVQQARRDRIERMLEAEATVDVTGRLDHWEQAVRTFADLLALARDPAQPFALDATEIQDVLPDQPVALRFWLRLRRHAGDDRTSAPDVIREQDADPAVRTAPNADQERP